jgi:hypothetical protein
MKLTDAQDKNFLKKFSFICLSGLCFFGILTIPFLSVPIFPSAYRPVSFIFLAPLGLLYIIILLKKKELTDNRALYWYCLFCAYIFIHSLFLSGLQQGRWSEFGFDFLLVFLGMCTLMGAFLASIELSERRFLQVINITFVMVIIIGVIEILSLFGPLSSSIRDVMMNIINGKTSSRLQLSTSEASWAGKVVLMMIPVFWVQRKNIFFYLCFLLSCLFLVLTFSLDVYFTTVMAVLFLLILRKKWNALIFSFVVLIGVTSLFIYVLPFLADNISGQTSYYLSRISKLENIQFIDIWTLLTIDGSVFVRIVYPIVSMEVFLDNFWFGVGLGGYPFEFNQYIQSYLDYGVNHSETISKIVNLSATAKFFPGRVLAEIGIIGFVVFLIFQWQLINNFKMVKFNESSHLIKIIGYWYPISLAFLLQFDSYIFVQCLFMWGAIAAIPYILNFKKI